MYWLCKTSDISSIKKRKRTNGLNEIEDYEA
jgi:hypothetical protein